ncbi:C-type lectin domain family 4 member G-like isoform X2 [Erinaceus europaeus]|uniref:C-type lectin domain family 4 member G-like isoform X2 n=1 Tax=Erinaceus europaeus TaxID=9365 RepID=A0ABM3WLE1_ERIEU|nr:C-type lectin domain family 4 member G-like isoform X2 [Erinaceus europaeus]
MDAAVYSNWGRGLQEGPKASRGKSKTPRRHVWGPEIQHYADPGSHQQPISATPGPWGHWGPWGHIFLIVSLVLGVIAVLWVLFLSIFFAKVSCEQCPRYWLPFQASCYFYSQSHGSWNDAQQSCVEAGRHLVIISGMDEQNFIAQYVGDHGHWVGLRAIRQGNQIQGYQWVDGVQLSFSHWNRKEPNDSGGVEDCIMMLKTGMWNDVQCDVKDLWICEKRRSC